jgi:hypothetical protein
VLTNTPQGPLPGEIYEAETWVFNGRDIKPRRRCVVVAAAPPGGRVTVYTRTTDETVPGVASVVDNANGLTEPGVFAYLRTADVEDFVEHSTYLGFLDEATMTKVYDMFEAAS